MKSAAPAATRLYKALLHLYPSTFRDEFGEEMACDFDEATDEAWTIGGWTRVLSAWSTVARDLLCSIPVQWLRSGVPILLATSVVWTLSFWVVIAQDVPQRDTRILVPPKNPDHEMQIMLLGLAVVVVLIAAIVLTTGWFWMFVVKRRSRASSPASHKTL